MSLQETKFIFFLPLLMLLLITPEIAAAASIPQELIGNWSSSTDEFCGIKFTSQGYTGSSDGEGYGCKVTAIRKLSEETSEDSTWKMAFICEGEFGKIRVNSIVHLQTIKGVRFKAQADTLNPKDAKKAIVQPLSIMYKCD